MISDSDVIMDPEEVKKREFLMKLEDYLKETRELILPNPPMDISDLKLRNLALFGNALKDCDNSAAKFPTFIANEPFAQPKSGELKRVKRGSLSRFVRATIWTTPLETMKKWKEPIDKNKALEFDDMAFLLQSYPPRLIGLYAFMDGALQNSSRACGGDVNTL
ncbi:hypothetical protein LY78DRAFT_674823 [Colletotrichum sublineola]|nr:hypothetical protein LY78DRAFT_674823 [Colletotrichum sublineola]